MRLFAGLALPSTAIERLSKLRLRLATPADGLRWSEPEQWHVTLRFFGEAEAAGVQCLKTAVETLSGKPVDLEIRALGWFAAKGILYAAVDASPSLAALQAQVVARTSDCGILPESRPFQPHITLARSKNRTGMATLRRLCQPEIPAFGPAVRWLAEEVLLYESILDRGGAQYDVLARQLLL